MIGSTAHLLLLLFYDLPFVPVSQDALHLWLALIGSKESRLKQGRGDGYHHHWWRIRYSSMHQTTSSGSNFLQQFLIFLERFIG
jgi:hypothetical protein